MFSDGFGTSLFVVRSRTFSEKSEAEQLLLRAVLISLLIHLMAYSTWQWGKSAGWWKDMRLPSWMRLTPALLSPAKMKLALKPPPQSEPSQLVFVDVDPALAEAQPPKKAKYYSANNSTAGNPHPKNLPIPEITGRQTKVVKTTENVPLRPQPLRPSPPKWDAKVVPEPKPLAPKAEVPGELAMAKPRPMKQEKSESSADTTTAVQQPPAEPVHTHTRPRTIAEAMAEKGMIGEKSRQAGGVGQLKMDSTFDAIKTSYGDYDREFIDAVRDRWYQLLENISVNGVGKVVVEFRLLPDGRVTDLKMTVNEVSDVLGLICQRAIFDPAPYRPWPLEMRRDIPKDYRDVTFTFYYTTE